MRNCYSNQRRGVLWGKHNSEEVLAITRCLPVRHTMRETARHFGISRGAVYFIEKSALTKIIRALRAWAASEKIHPVKKS